MDKLKFGIIGCQHMHIADFIGEMLELGHECLGIYDPYGGRPVETICEKFQIPLVHNSELLFGSIDLVGCASVNSEKIDVIELCEKLGKHVMLDKPAVT